MADTNDNTAFLAELDAPVKPRKLNYVIREGVRALSYSKISTFGNCPRKFYLGELKGGRSFSPTIDTAYGHAVGAGIQEFFRYAETNSIEQAKQRAVVAAIAAYDYLDLSEEKSYSKKDLWWAVLAVEKFCSEVGIQILSNFKLAYINGVPGIELTFLIQINPTTDYQGHIDLVLEERTTGELYVVEVKTSMNAPTPSDWANSFQTLGYNTVLHAYAKGRGVNFNVLYICFATKEREFYPMTFHKSVAARMEFITTLLLDVDTMDKYESHGFWPKRGNNCSAYNKPCYLFGICDTHSMEASTDSAYEGLALEDVTIVLTLEEMLAAEEHALETTDAYGVNWSNM